MFIRVSPMKGVVRFIRSRKLAPQYIGPFSITERIGSVAYRLLLLAQFSAIHDVFHVSQLRKCLRDSDSILEPELWKKLKFCLILLMSNILFVLLLRRSSAFEIKMFLLLKFNGPQILRIALGNLESSSSEHIRTYFPVLFEVNFLFQISFVLICFYGCYFLFICSL